MAAELPKERKIQIFDMLLGDVDAETLEFLRRRILQRKRVPQQDSALILADISMVCASGWPAGMFRMNPAHSTRAVRTLREAIKMVGGAGDPDGLPPNSSGPLENEDPL